MKKLFILNGYAQSGKDTFVDMITQELRGDVLNVSSVGEIREIATEYFGWDGVTKDTPTRQLLSDLKNLQTNYCNGPFHYMCKKIDTSDKRAIFVHIREINEIKKMRERYSDATTIAISRPEYDKDVISDIYNFRYDEYIFNDGTLEDLHMKAKQFVFRRELDLL